MLAVLLLSPRKRNSCRLSSCARLIESFEKWIGRGKTYILCGKCSDDDFYVAQFGKPGEIEDFN